MTRIQPLTKRQREIYEYVATFIRDHSFAPSLEEICTAHGRAMATIHKHLTNLETKGYIRRRRGHARFIVILVGPGCCPTCGRELEAKVDALSAMKSGSEGVESKAVEKEGATSIPT